jgi:hypothetical protein
MNMAGSVCFECEQGLSAFQRLRFRYFCSEKHHTDWVQEFNILGLLRLQEEGARMSRQEIQPRFGTVPPLAGEVSGVERRVAGRVELDAPVRVTLLNGNITAHAGRFVNASTRGMKITMGSELFVGTRIRVDCGDHEIVGEVRRCHTGAAGYVIGLETTAWKDRRELSSAASKLGDFPELRHASNC